MSKVFVGDDFAHECLDDDCLAVIDTGAAQRIPFPRACRRCPASVRSPRLAPTGTSIIAGPPYAINPVIKQIGYVAPDCSNRDTLPAVRGHRSRALLE